MSKACIEFLELGVGYLLECTPIFTHIASSPLISSGLRSLSPHRHFEQSMKRWNWGKYIPRVYFIPATTIGNLLGTDRDDALARASFPYMLVNEALSYSRSGGSSRYSASSSGTACSRRRWKS